MKMILKVSRCRHDRRHEARDLSCGEALDGALAPTDRDKVIACGRLGLCGGAGASASLRAWVEAAATIAKVAATACDLDGRSEMLESSAVHGE